MLKWNSFLQKSEVFKNRTSSVTRNKIGFVPRYWRREEKVGKNFCTVQKEHWLQWIIFPSVFFNMIRVSIVAFSDSATEPRRISFDYFVAHAQADINPNKNSPIREQLHVKSHFFNGQNLYSPMRDLTSFLLSIYYNYSMYFGVDG